VRTSAHLPVSLRSAALVPCVCDRTMDLTTLLPTCRRSSTASGRSENDTTVTRPRNRVEIKSYVSPWFYSSVCPCLRWSKLFFIMVVVMIRSHCGGELSLTSRQSGSRCSASCHLPSQTCGRPMFGLQRRTYRQCTHRSSARVCLAGAIKG
jgi:hypothetical protein